MITNILKSSKLVFSSAYKMPMTMHMNSLNKSISTVFNMKRYIQTNQKANENEIKQQQEQDNISQLAAATTQITTTPSFLERHLPSKYHPYIMLGRYEKPIGYLLLFWPCAWGAALGQPILQPLALAHLVGTFYFGSAVMRAAGCIVNDMWDRDFDNKVERTKSRPLASGQLSMKQAGGFLFLHLCGGLLTLTQLNVSAIALSFGIVPIAALYPLFKRFTYYPQAVLGSCFNWGVMVGYAAATASGAINLQVALPAYIGGVLWTLIYDTIYAHQDKTDDVKIGVKSTALAWGDNTKLVMQGLWGAQLALFMYTGVQADLGLPYFPCCLASHLYLWRLIQDFNMNDSKTCWNFFVLNKNFGLLLFLSILIGKIFPKDVEYDEDEEEQQQEELKKQEQNLNQQKLAIKQ